MLAVAAAVGATFAERPAHAAERPMSNTLWLSAGAGVTFGTSVNLEAAGTDVVLTATDTAAPAFGIGMHFRTSRFDMGLMFGHIGGGTFEGFSQERPIGGKARIAAMLRWRYLDERWGSLYMRLSPGVLLLTHTDELRNEAAKALGRPQGAINGIDEYNIGFTFGVAFGLMVYASEWIGIYAEFEGITASTSMQDDAQEVGYTAFQPLFSFGVEARMF